MSAPLPPAAALGLQLLANQIWETCTANPNQVDDSLAALHRAVESALLSGLDPANIVEATEGLVTEAEAKGLRANIMPRLVQAPDPSQHRCHIHRSYHLTCAEFDLLLADNGACCKICGSVPGPHESSLLIEHDHAFGRRAVRGITCISCNKRVEAHEKGRKFNRDVSVYLRDPWYRRAELTNLDCSATCHRASHRRAVPADVLVGASWMFRRVIVERLKAQRAGEKQDAPLPE